MSLPSKDDWILKAFIAILKSNHGLTHWRAPSFSLLSRKTVALKGRQKIARGFIAG